MKDFHKFIVDNGLDYGKPGMLVLDGHAWQVNIDVVQVAMSSNIKPQYLALLRSVSLIPHSRPLHEL